MRPDNRLIVGIAYATTCLIWSSTMIVLKVGLTGAPPMTSVAIRFMIATLLVFAILKLSGTRWPRERKFIKLSVFLGVFHMTLPYILVYWGTQHIPAGLAAVLYSTMPIFVAIIARVMLGDTLTFKKVAGIAVGFSGVWVIFMDSGSFGGLQGFRGMLAVVGSALFTSFAAVVTKRDGRDYNPLATLLMPLGIGAVLTGLVGAPIERSNPLSYDGLTWFTIVYLAVLGSVVAFSVYLWTLKRVSVTVLAYQTFIIPVLAVIQGWLFLGEKLTARVGVGAALILTGIALATLWRSRGTRRHQPTVS